MSNDLLKDALDDAIHGRETSAMAEAVNNVAVAEGLSKADLEKIEASLHNATLTDEKLRRSADEMEHAAAGVGPFAPKTTPIEPVASERGWGQREA